MADGADPRIPDVLRDLPVPVERSLEGTLGFRITALGDDEARAEVAVTDRVRQPFGIVHGGTYAALAEMLASAATIAVVAAHGDGAVGASNQTHFLRPCADGTVHATARRRHAGRTTWIWDVDMSDDAGRLCATSRVTLAVRPRAELAPRP